MELHKLTDDSLQSKVHNWLLKTGFPLEMRTARAIYQDDRLNEWDMYSGREYVDEKAGVVREIDIRGFNWCSIRVPGTKAHLGAWVDVVIECKATSSPWVILKDPTDFHSGDRPLIDFGRGYLYEVRNEQVKNQLTNLVMQFAAAFNPGQRHHRQSGYGIIEALKEPGGKNSAYDAVQQVLSACRGIAKTFFRDFDDFAFYCAVPVIVTTASLFEASLTEGSGELVLEPVDWGSVLTIDNRTPHRRVTVINESALPKLNDDMANWALMAPTTLETLDLSALSVQPDIALHPFHLPYRPEERERQADGVTGLTASDNDSGAPRC